MSARPSTTRGAARARREHGPCGPAARGHFPNAAALKDVHLAIMSLNPTGKGRQRWSGRHRLYSAVACSTQILKYAEVDA